MANPVKLLVVLNSAPQSGSRARDALDLLLTAGAFDLSPTVLFLGDAVYQLLADQQTDRINQKNGAQMLKVLPMYDITRLYVEEEALAARRLTTDSLILPAEPMTQQAISQLFHQYDRILSF